MTSRSWRTAIGPTSRTADHSSGAVHARHHRLFDHRDLAPGPCKEPLLSSSQPSTEAPVVRRRPTLPPGLALTGGAITFTSLYLAAGALTPLLVVYKEQWNFPPALLTLAFAVYAIGFLAAVLTLGSLSDHVGRRPVLIGALVIQVASNVLFLVASDIGWVIAGRIVQGIAGGAATTAFTAALVELAPDNRKRLGT